MPSGQFSLLTLETHQDKLSLLRIITERALYDWSREHARARTSLVHWVQVTKQSNWLSSQSIRRTFPTADQVSVASGRSVIIFNIAGNRFRLICAVHFKTKCVFALRFMTHADYDKADWMREL